MNDSVLSSTIAGSWYPGTPEELNRLFDRLTAELPERKTDSESAPNVLILPHAGYVYSAPAAMFGIREIRNAPFRRVVVLCPSHRAGFRNRLVAPESSAVRTPLGIIPVDTAALEQVAAAFPVELNDTIHRNEHAAQIQYPLLQYALRNFSVLPLVVGEFSDEGFRRAAVALRKLLDDSTLFVVSSDFTHYGSDFDYTPYGSGKAALEKVREADLAAFDAIRAVDPARFSECIRQTGATICGRNPLELILRMLPKTTRFELLDYTSSAELTGGYSSFVCYLCAVGRAPVEPEETAAEEGKMAENRKFESSVPDVFSPEEKEKLLGMARRAIGHVLRSGRVFPADVFRDEAVGAMRENMGCFVTLTRREDGQLRGCIGEIEPFRPLYQAVTMRAVDAAFRDPRFEPLSEAEFEHVQIEISALTPARPVASWRDIEIGRHGMTLSKYGRSAVFLPQVPVEQGWDLPTTLTFLARKAGLRPEDWKDGAEFTVFEAVVFHEQ